MNGTHALLGVLCLLGMSCHQESSSAASPAPLAMPPSDGGAPDPLAEKLRHCPLTVDGATAEVRDVDGGVELSVHVTTEAARQELMKRAHHLEEFTKHKPTNIAHGGGQGGGFMRDCPVVTKDTRVDATERADGVSIQVTALDGDAASLRSETHRRLDALRARKN